MIRFKSIKLTVLQKYCECFGKFRRGEKLLACVVEVKISLEIKERIQSRRKYE